MNCKNVFSENMYNISTLNQPITENVRRFYYVNVSFNYFSAAWFSQDKGNASGLYMAGKMQY